MVHGDAREAKGETGEWSTLHTTSEHGVSSITTADAHTSAASSRLNWRLRRYKWIGPFGRKTKSGFCACAIAFQLASTFVSASNNMFSVISLKKRYSSPITSPRGPEGSRKLRFPDYVTMAQDSGKVVSLTHWLLFTPRKCSWYSFLLEAESTPGP